MKMNKEKLITKIIDWILWIIIICLLIYGLKNGLFIRTVEVCSSNYVNFTYLIS